jgi:hypothetical protein
MQSLSWQGSHAYPCQQQTCMQAQHTLTAHKVNNQPHLPCQQVAALLCLYPLLLLCYVDNAPLWEIALTWQGGLRLRAICACNQ